MVSKRDESRLREAEGRYQAIFEQSPYGILIIDTAGRIIEFNEVTHQQLGYSKKEFAKLNVSDIDPFQSPEEIKASMKDVLKKGKAEFDVKHRTKDGQLRDVHVITQVVNLSGKKVFQAIWHDVTEQKQAEESLRKYHVGLEDLVKERTTELAAVNKKLQKDITKRKRTEDKLRDSEERFRNIFEKGPLGMIIFDPAWRVMKTNKAIYDMLRYTELELTGRSLGDIAYSEDKAKGATLSKQLVSGKIPLVQLEMRYIKKSGEIVWTNHVTTAVRDRSGTILYFLSMIEDISDRKFAQQESERLIQELQDALAKIKTLRGLLPMCAWCNKVRDDRGYWKRVETYIQEHSDASFTHGICPSCLKKADPETYAQYTEEIGEKFHAEKRQCERVQYNDTVKYMASFVNEESSKAAIFHADIVDVSEEGMCIITDHALKRDAILIFRDGDIDRSGIVRWRNKVDGDNTYRVGVKFLTG
jgi:PAS domain S-box-containing protein